MGNYMRGYSSRTRRRRASYKKTNSLYRESYYNRSWDRGGGRRGRNSSSAVLYGILGGTAALIIILFAVALVAANSHSGTKSSGASAGSEPQGGAVSDAAAASDDGADGGAPNTLTEAVEAVGTLDAGAVSEPAPKMRSKAIALTFDDGPSTANTPLILSLLEKYKAHATFFVVGNRVEAGADLLKKELEIGCEIGTHSWDHPNLSKMSMEQVKKNVNKTVKLVKKLTGYEISLLRPPYGAISDVMRKKLDMPMILWSVDTLDWKSRNADAVFKQVKRQVSDGAVILVHDIHESTAKSMKKILPWLVKQDYDILTVSELMERKGVKMKNGKAYCDAN